MRGVVALWVTAALTLDRSTRTGGADIGDVVSLLQQMLERFSSQASADQQAWGQYSAWSDQQEQDKNAFLQEQQSVVSVNAAQQHASESIVQSVTEALTLLRQEVAQTTQSIAELQKMREDEHGEFEKQLRDLEHTIDAVTRGIEILEGHYGAAQLAQVKPALAQAMQLAAVSTQVMSAEERGVLTRLAQDPNYLSEEYQGRDYSGSTNQAGGGTVVSTLTKLRDGMVDAKREAVSQENSARRQFESAKATKDQDVERDRQEIAVKTDQLAEAKATGEMAAAAVTQATLNINEAQTALTELAQQYKHTQEVYNERVRTRGAEVTATQGALDALRGVAATFTLLQKPQSSKLLLQVGPPPALARVARRLRTLGDRDHSAALIEACTAVQRLGHTATGAFNPEATDPVKDLLRQLIQRLQDEASAETSHKEWCDQEKGSAKGAKEARESSIAALEQEVPRLGTAIAILGREIEFAKATLERVADETAAASAVRASNNEEFTRAREDHQQVISALDQALAQLGGVRFSLLQLKQSPFSSVTQAPAASDAARMLQDLRTRYASALSDLETEEQQQLAAFEELKQSNEVFRRATEQTLRSKEAEKRQKVQRKGEAEQELTGARAELEQVTQYLADLRPSCDDIRSTFEERQRRRQAEVEALQAALAALESAA